MKTYILCLLALMPVLVFSSAITILNESQDEITLQFNLPEYDLEDIEVSGKKYQRIICDEGQIHAEEGYPELKVFTTAIALPIDGSAILKVQNHKSSSLSQVEILPSYSMHMKGEEAGYERIPSFQAYSASGLYPLEVAALGEEAFIGNRKFVPLMIFPFQYDAATRSLRVHNKFQITLSIRGSKSPTKDWQLSKNPIDAAGESLFINNASSLSWRLPKAKAGTYEASKNSTSQIHEIQLIVDSEGIYKLAYAELKDFIIEMTDSLGMELSWNIDNVDPRNLELRDENGQVPIHFYGEEDGGFDPGDYFEFFGDRHYGDTSYQDDFTAENVYTLSLKETYGARMVVENGGLIENNPLLYTQADAYEETIHLDEQLVSDKLGRGWSSANPTYYREDLWFWRKINAPNLDIVPIELEYPFDSNIRSASTRILLQGLTYKEELFEGEYDHEASIRLNQAMVDDHTWIGQTEQLFENQEPISNSFLRHGTNNVYISLSGNTAMGDREQVLLDYIDLTYWRQYRTDKDYIMFRKPGDRPNGLFQFDLQGFSSPNVSVYKIGSSIFSNLQIEPFNVGGSAPWTVSLQDNVSSQAVRYYAVEESSKKTPIALRMNIPSDLRNPYNAANVIMITPYEFVLSAGTQELKNLWESDGYTVQIVDLQDIYDEFNSGIVSAEAIRDFLRYAYNNWSNPQLSHVMLLGEGVADSRDNSPSRKYNLIPVRKTWTYKHGATASDSWYGCLVGEDPVPDIIISRLNIWDHEQIQTYATKAVSYRENLLTNRLWNSHITFTAGGKIDDASDIFSQQSERIRRRVVPPDYRVSRVYTSTQTVSPDYFGGTFNLKDAINSGTQFVQFMGHGGGRIWADYSLFNFADVATLNNQAYPIFLSLACYASAFDTNGASSISEALVLQPDKGAIVALGFSGLGYLDHDEGWGLAYNEATLMHDFNSLGEAYLYTLARFYTTTSSAAARYALTDGSVFLGDPLIKLNKPQADVDVTVEGYNAQPGDTFAISAEFPASVNAARLYVMKPSEKIVNVPYDLPVVNGVFNASYTIPEDDSNATRKVLVAGYSSDKEYVGSNAFAIGRPLLNHHAYLPESPTYADSIGFVAKLFTSVEIVSMDCYVRTDSVVVEGVLYTTWESLPMQVSQQDTTLWQSTQKLNSYNPGKELAFKYRFTMADGQNLESGMNYLVIPGPDLFLRDIVFDAADGIPKLKVKASNIGNYPSLQTDLSLFYRPAGGTYTYLSRQDFAPMGVNEDRWETIMLDGVPNGNISLEARVNTTNAFPEWHMFVNTNNYIEITMPFNYFSVDSSGGTYNSVDDNLSCTVPSSFVQSGTTGLAINTLEALAPLNQPDVSSLLMLNDDALSDDGLSDNQYSIPYEIKFTDPALSDSLGIFNNGMRLELTFRYHNTDEETQANENDNSYKIYRYNEEFQKWILIGGHVSPGGDFVNFEVNRSGIYSIFRNTDTQEPSVDVNVQDQEFTIGGYVAGNGVISLLLSDANGIDVIDNSIRVYMNGVEVPQGDFVISINSENINRVPIKYQLALGRGNHELKVDCRDLNGNFATREVQFVVNDKFDITNIGNYPNPVLGKAQDPKNDGRTRFTYRLTDTADNVYIKVYTISGRLVKTFRNLPTGVGYHEYPRTVYAWDCKDEQGFTLANGTYFYRVVASKGNKKIEKIMKMAILR